MTNPLPSLADDLRRAGVGDVRFDRKHRVLYSTDASIYQIEPIGVVIPRSVEEVIATVTVCSQQGAPVLPRGAGTSLAGQTVGHAVIVDTTRHLDKIIEINAEERWVRCQPGVVLDQVNAALRPHGLMLGPDPASGSRATVGGTVGNNGTGAHSILYGMIADNVLAVDAVLADGRVVRFDETFFNQPPAGAATLAAGLQSILTTYGDAIRRDFPRHWRRASGYNLDKLLARSETGQSGVTSNAVAGLRPSHATNPAQLIAGSEGTLAFMTAVTLRAVPRPAGTVLAMVHFDDLAAAAEATPPLLALNPSAVELMDKLLLDLCRQHPAYGQRLTFVEGDPACVLAVEFYVESEAEGRARLDGLRAQLAVHGHRGAVVPLLDPAAQANAWAVRKTGLTLLLGQRGDVKPAGFMEDVAVPVEHLPAYMRSVQRMMAEHGKQAAYYAHASAGCLHIRPLLNLKTAADIAVMDAMQAELLALIRPLGGVLSGEHGDGLKLTHLNRALFGEAVTRAFAETKLAFDPGNLFNPGKKVTEEVLQEVRERKERRETREERETREKEGGHVTDLALLRYGPGYQTIELSPFFDWSADGGLARAVEMCNGSGDCRKASGVMCPSFQATREEEHSTRGRANLLRAALSGQLSGKAWTDPAVHEALDLCLGCKACKTECPSSVDMAKIKAEVQAQRYAVEGTPLPARLLGHIHTVNRLAAPVAPLANTALRTRPARAVLSRLVDLHPARALPPIAHPTFTSWFAARQINNSSFTIHSSPISGQVILFPDTFTTYNYPQIGIAAVQVLEAAGFQVQLAPRVCCGRPMLSQGLVEDARRQAAKNVELLYPLAAQGLPILICEPSCAAAFHEEYHDLLPDDPRVAVLARQVYLIDDWLAQQVAAGLTLPVHALPQPILFHGHCHQKATTGTTGSLAALRTAPGQQVSQIDAGCCGMAGAFGYTADHYEVSMAIARERLAPAIDAAPDALICADGASCRQQIEHVTGRRVYHVVEVLAQGLV
ncbi:MAG TPA: FAD-binding protein [Anaerolineae bacterium]|nr:FAD-binding protein [Anaerolineae bacterium]